MRRVDFDHVIAAAANIVELDEFVVIGSQAILGTRPDAPPTLLESMEVDLYPRAAPDRAIEVEGALGDGSYFHSTYGYFAHGVGPGTAKAPAGWENRLIPVVVPGRVGSGRSPTAYCLEAHDLVLAKCVRGDDRDWSYAQAALDADLVDRDILLERADDLPIAVERRSTIRQRLGIL
jgi:hypothetical protein